MMSLDHKYDIQLYLLTETISLIIKSAVYTAALSDMGGKDHAEKVVLHLMENKFDVEHSIYMDKYYNSHSFSKNCWKKTYSTEHLGVTDNNSLKMQRIRN